jgi:hypothetical protein
VEYGVLHIGPHQNSWATSAGGSFGFANVLELYETVTNSRVESEHHPAKRSPESTFLNYLAGWGWQLIAAYPHPSGGIQYVLERACTFEPSGCYSE